MYIQNLYKGNWHFGFVGNTWAKEMLNWCERFIHFRHIHATTQQIATPTIQVKCGSIHHDSHKGGGGEGVGGGPLPADLSHATRMKMGKSSVTI